MALSWAAKDSGGDAHNYRGPQDVLRTLGWDSAGTLFPKRNEKEY